MGGRSLAEVMRAKGVDLGLVVVIEKKGDEDVLASDPSGKAGVSLDPSPPTSCRQDSWGGRGLHGSQLDALRRKAKTGTSGRQQAL